MLKPAGTFSFAVGNLSGVAGIGGAVLVRLQAAAGILRALERVRISLLLRRAAAAAAEDAVEKTHARSLCSGADP